MAEVSYTMVSASDGEHYVKFGLEASESCDVAIRMYITKKGQRLADWMQSLGIGWISFMGDEVWGHNSDNVVRCNFYGEQKDMVVGVVFNEMPNELKVLDAVEIHSDEDWEIESIDIPATLNYPNGMYSKIPEGRFKRREGVLYAEFLRNMKTGQSTINPLQALKGEPLRGDSAYMVLRSSATGAMSLFKVDIKATLSR